MEIKRREEISLNRKWHLEDILSDESAIPAIIDECKKRLEVLKSYKGKLNFESVLEFLNKDDELSLIAEKLYTYANMRSDEDKGNGFYLELSEKASMLLVEIGEGLSFFRAELAAFETAELERMLDAEAYRDYSMLIKGILRNKKHILSEKEEALLSGMSSFSGDFREIFQVFDNADLDFGTIEVNGEQQPLTHSSYSVFLQNHDQNIRKTAFDAIYKKYAEFTNTLAANYAGNVKRNVFSAKTRGFSSALEKALFAENISSGVYENLIKCIESNTPVMHKYVALRKDILKLEENHMYDLYVPLAEDNDRIYEYNVAYATVVEALAPLGEEYTALLKEAENGGWIDVEPCKGKRSGAYSWGAYGIHPYVLLNHNGTLHDMFTIAHEMGHAMHSYYSDKNQPYSKAQYEIFVAEIASTVNEVLLLKHLLRTGAAPKKYLLSYYLDMFRTTVFRQTMFAEFEKFAHETVESGEPLSSGKLSGYYLSLNEKYYGGGVIHDEGIKYEWSRIPHFYNSFYVYKYATGLITAVNIAGRLLEEGSGYLEKYKAFLKSGGSKYPLEILLDAGINLEKDGVFDFAMKEFRDTLNALEAECR